MACRPLRLENGCGLRHRNESSGERRCLGAKRRGQALVEFAIVCLAVYLLLAAILTFGQWLYSAQGLQQAVDVAAREISRTPLPAAQITTEASAEAP